MAVRVEVRLKSKSGAELKTAAVANSAFESDVVELIVPERVAKELGLFPKLPAGSEI